MPTQRSLTDIEALALYAWGTHSSLTTTAAAAGTTMTEASDLLRRLCDLDRRRAHAISARGTVDETPRPRRIVRAAPRPAPAVDPDAHWTTRAGCRDRNALFFDVNEIALAAHICRRHCPVRKECAARLDQIQPVGGVAAGIVFGADGSRNARQPAAIRCAECPGGRRNRSLDLAGAR